MALRTGGPSIEVWDRVPMSCRAMGGTYGAAAGMGAYDMGGVGFVREDSHGTMRDTYFVGRLVDELGQGRPVVLASVLATRGSSPRPAGARMALLPDGVWLGTIGGGPVERVVQERCVGMLAGREHGSLEWFTHAKTGTACGGDALVGMRMLDPSVDGDVLSRMHDGLSRGRSLLLSEEWGDATAPRMTLGTYGGQGAMGGVALPTTPTWDEATRAYREPLTVDPTAYVFGGGHIGQKLCPVLASVGFSVVIFDDRADMAVPELFPQARGVVCGDFHHIAEKVDIARNDYAVVMTHGHVADIDVLEQLAHARPAYVGCIGSRRKAALVRDTLVRRGVERAWADDVRLPIGEDILAVTPGEIAVSIAAQMIRCRAGLRPGDGRSHSSQAPTATA